MVWGAVGYTYLYLLVCNNGTLDSLSYIDGVLRPVALPFNRALRNPTFQQDNAQLHVAGIVWLLQWPARSPDLSSIEKVWSMVDERLARRHTPVTTVDKLWHRVEASWASVPVHAIQYL
ncbi:transposable element Tcb1 transposase [Trichonephila clavipes]|nr:transposable element Tcb1 transposase [Trichonephila clavipes]